MLPRLLPLGLAYFVVAGFSVGLTRFEGGVAFIWGATSILIAVLVKTRRSAWAAPMVACGVASFMATGLWGLGWTAAPAFVLVNLAEAGSAAWIMRQRRHAARTLDSIGWFGWFVFSVGLVGPLVGSLLAASWFVAEGRPALPAFTASFAGHALGSLTFTPLAMMVTGSRARRATWREFRRRSRDSLLLVALVVLISAGVFSQDALPLLFLPILFIILATFRVHREGAALAIVVLAFVGGGLTALGHGPVQLVAGDLAGRLQFFQFYLAATLLTVLPVAADLHTRRRLMRQLRFSEERYRLLADYSTDILMHIDLDGRIRFVSPSIRQLGGYEPAELVGRNANLLIAPDHLEAVRAAHQATILAGGRTKVYDYQGITKDGERRWFETHSRAIVDSDGQLDGVLCIIRNVDRRKAREESLAAAAMTDHLTGLPNRRAFLTEASDAALSAGSCVVVLDIDHFKQVNDRHGHDAGDEVLRSFASVALRLMRQCDMAARLGGEEFAFLVRDATVDQAMRICDRFRSEMASTVTLAADSAITVTVSGGVAPIGEAGLDAALRSADQALYRAKAAGRDQMALAA
jgi:diguanylate cyclase (GGDEF)-like protein/PAS domain S-box-containing protein